VTDEPGPLAEGSDLPRVPLVHQASALSRTAWSADIVGQSIECLFLCLRADEVNLLRPIHAESLRLGWRPNHEAGDIVIAACERYGLAPILAHSTSWRFESGRVVLTYIAAVEAPDVLNEHLTEVPVVRSDLARGSAFAPPPQIGTAQVIEHACRHLAWLIKDDPEVAAAIPEWATYLGTFEPEPFRNFGAPS